MGAMPMGAPGWPELAAMVASTYGGYGQSALARANEAVGEGELPATYGQQTDGVDGEFVGFTVTHVCERGRDCEDEGGG